MKAGALTRRTHALRGLRLALDFLEKEIGYAHSPLPQALERAARVSAWPVDLLFHTAAAALKTGKGLPAGAAWDCAVEKIRAAGVFADEDLAIIVLVGERLGITDAPDQIRLLRLTAEEIKIQEEKSRQQEADEKKLWSYGGFLAGAMICLLMF